MPTNPRKFRQRRRSFASGVVVGILLSALVLASVTSLGLAYLQQSASTQGVVDAMAPVDPSAGDTVQLYFPLERFLAWRSTPALGLGMQGSAVHVHIVSHLIRQLPLSLSVDVYGQPGVQNGYFTLTSVRGYVDHIPIPSTWLLQAIAADGARYGIRVDTSSDSLLIDKSYENYRLVGYDHTTRDLMIAIPVAIVERAARGKSVL